MWGVSPSSCPASFPHPFLQILFFNSPVVWIASPHSVFPGHLLPTFLSLIRLWESLLFILLPQRKGLEKELKQWTAHYQACCYGDFGRDSLKHALEFLQLKDKKAGKYPLTSHPSLTDRSLRASEPWNLLACSLQGWNVFHRWWCCRKGGWPSGTPRVSSCLTLGKALSKELRADKARDFIRKGHPGGAQEGEGAQGSSSATWLAVSGFTGMWLASRWSLASHSDSGSFLVAHVSLSQGGRQREGSWEVVGPVASPFDLSGTLPVGGGSCPKATHADGCWGAWPGRAVQPVCFP